MGWGSQEGEEIAWERRARHEGWDLGTCTGHAVHTYAYVCMSACVANVM